MDEAAVDRILERELSRLAGSFQERQRLLAEGGVAGGNPFKAGLLSEDEILAQRTGRSFDSMLGNTLETILHALAEARYPGCSPQTVLGVGSGPDCHLRRRPPGATYRDGSAKTVIWTRLKREHVCAVAATLCEGIAESGVRIGSPAFAAALTEARDEVRGHGLCKEAWPVMVDMWVEDENVGFGEVKAGGELDNTKAKIEVQELLVAALVLERQRVPRVFVLYSNRGEGRAIGGGLPTYFEPSNLLVADDVWSLVLPEGMSVAEFIERHQRIGAHCRAAV